MITTTCPIAACTLILYLTFGDVGTRHSIISLHLYYCTISERSPLLYLAAVNFDFFLLLAPYPPSSSPSSNRELYLSNAAALHSKISFSKVNFSVSWSFCNCVKTLQKAPPVPKSRTFFIDHQKLKLTHKLYLIPALF